MHWVSSSRQVSPASELWAPEVQWTDQSAASCCSFLSSLHLPQQARTDGRPPWARFSWWFLLINGYINLHCHLVRLQGDFLGFICNSVSSFVPCHIFWNDFDLVLWNGEKLLSDSGMPDKYGPWYKSTRVKTFYSNESSWSACTSEVSNYYK